VALYSFHKATLVSNQNNQTCKLTMDNQPHEQTDSSIRNILLPATVPLHPSFVETTKRTAKVRRSGGAMKKDSVAAGPLPYRKRQPRKKVVDETTSAKSEGQPDGSSVVGVGGLEQNVFDWAQRVNLICALNTTQQTQVLPVDGSPQRARGHGGFPPTVSPHPNLAESPFAIARDDTVGVSALTPAQTGENSSQANILNDSRLLYDIRSFQSEPNNANSNQCLEPLINVLGEINPTPYLCNNWSESTLTDNNSQEKLFPTQGDALADRGNNGQGGGAQSGMQQEDYANLWNSLVGAYISSQQLQHYGNTANASNVNPFGISATSIGGEIMNSSPVTSVPEPKTFGVASRHDVKSQPNSQTVVANNAGPHSLVGMDIFIPAADSATQQTPVPPSCMSSPEVLNPNQQNTQAMDIYQPLYGGTGVFPSYLAPINNVAFIGYLGNSTQLFNNNNNGVMPINASYMEEYTKHYNIYLSYYRWLIAQYNAGNLKG